MYTLLLRLMFISALIQLGLNITTLTPTKLERASRDVLRIDWKPISVFPEEAKKFR